MKKRIFFLYRTERQPIYDAWIKGKGPNHFLYGLNHLRDFGYKVEFSDIGQSRRNILYWLLFPIDYFSFQKCSVSFKLYLTLRLLPKFSKSDIVISTVDSVGLPILLLKKIARSNTPIVYISISFITRMKSIRKSAFFRFYRNLLQEANVIVCHTYLEKKLYRELMPELVPKIKVIPFGIDIDFFFCSHRQDKFILSAGFDRTRDFSLLAKVARRLTKEEFLIVTGYNNVKGISFPDNVTLRFNIPYWEMKKLYCKAKLVLIPLKKGLHPSGQVSLLESIASGNRIVVTRKRGLLREYNEIFCKRNTIPLAFCNAEDVDDTYKAIIETLKCKRGSSTLDKQYDSKSYAEKIDRIIEEL